MANRADDPGINLREYIERLLAERDRQYDLRFKAAETGFIAALNNAEKSMLAAFSASEKAVLKAEDAQREYNIRSNEFRGQLDDQAKLLMPRTEAISMFRNIDDKIALVNKDIASLRESRSEGGGKSAAVSMVWGIAIAILGILIAITGLFLRR
jgi:hypothetical protein